MKDKIGESSLYSKEKGHKDGTDNSVHCSEESSTENAFKPQLKYVYIVLSEPFPDSPDLVKFVLCVPSTSP